MHAFLISFCSIAGLHFLVLVSPGPDFILNTKNALLYCRKTAVCTALGTTLGTTVHLSYCIVAIQLVADYSDTVFMIFKHVGGAYLVYMGIKSLLKKQDFVQETAQILAKSASLDPRKAMRQGFLCDILNPKVGLFFISLFTLVIEPDTPLWQQIVYAVWMSLVTFLWFYFMACSITHPAVRKHLYHVQPFLMKFLGGLLCVLGITLLLLPM